MARKPGVYAHLTPHLPKYPGVDPSKREIVSAVQAVIKSPTERDTSTDPQRVEAIVQSMEEHFALLCDIVKTSTNGKQYASEYARVYAEIRDLQDRLKAWGSNLEVLLDAYQELYVNQAEVEGVSSMRIASGESVSFYYEPYPQVIDAEAFRLWCLANGFERKMVLHPSIVSSHTKERLLAGEPEPDGVKIFAKPMLRLTKA